MKSAKNIETFMFNYAQYEVSDGENTVLLTVNYADNTYEIEGVGGNQQAAFQRAVRQVARNLLRRKHGVNFADRVR